MYLTAEPPGPGADDPVDVVIPPQVADVNQGLGVILDVPPVPDAGRAADKAIIFALKWPGLGLWTADFVKHRRCHLKKMMKLKSYWQTILSLREDGGDTEEEEADHNHVDCKGVDDTAVLCRPPRRFINRVTGVV